MVVNPTQPSRSPKQRDDISREGYLRRRLNAEMIDADLQHYVVQSDDTLNPRRIIRRANDNPGRCYIVDDAAARQSNDRLDRTVRGVVVPFLIRVEIG